MQSEPCAKDFLAYLVHSTTFFTTTMCTVDNQEQILSILSEMTEDDDAAVDLCTEASGLLCQIKRHYFFEIGKFLVRVLGVLKPANAILQSQSVDLCSASEVVSGALDSLKNIREDDCWGVSSPAEDESHPTKRRRTMSKHLGQSVVLSTLGHTDSGDPTISPYQSLKRSLLNILDRAISEMETRFSHKNIDLMTTISSLAPKSSAFLDSTLLHPLAVMAGTVYKEAFPELHKLYVTALVIGVSSALCESSFSTLSQVLTPYRRTMLHKRKRNLVILAHKKSITNNLDMDEFVRVFAKGNRRLL
uniref:HAT C-terminal dimerisation domain-containing protein n=1 Tax=Erpetoichthys calabaricus TaxID=27687 RepID=A0A8C4TJA3_ERPCA